MADRISAMITEIGSRSRDLEWDANLVEEHAEIP